MKEIPMNDKQKLVLIETFNPYAWMHEASHPPQQNTIQISKPNVGNDFGSMWSLINFFEKYAIKIAKETGKIDVVSFRPDDVGASIVSVGIRKGSGKILDGIENSDLVGAKTAKDFNEYYINDDQAIEKAWAKTGGFTMFGAMDQEENAGVITPDGKNHEIPDGAMDKIMAIFAKTLSTITGKTFVPPQLGSSMPE
jgi:hypothetical protein